MRLSHARRAISVRFDDPNLVSCAGLVPVMALADRCGLTSLLDRHVKIAAKGGANAATKILAIIAGMVCGEARTIHNSSCQRRDPIVGRCISMRKRPRPSALPSIDDQMSNEKRSSGKRAVESSQPR